MTDTVSLSKSKRWPIGPGARARFIQARDQ